MSSEYNRRPGRSPHDPDPSDPLARLFPHTAFFRSLPDDLAGDDEEALYATDQGGFVMTRDEALRIFHRLIAGIDAIGDETIEAHNREVLAGLRQDPRSRYADDSSSARRTPPPKPPRPDRPGDVYLLTNGLLYKIGVSKDVRRRAREIERSSGLPVAILAFRRVPDMLTAELELHERYASYRREGEWFDLPEDELEVLLAEMGGAV